MRPRTTAFALFVLDAVVALVVFNLISYARGIPGFEAPVLVPLAVPIAVFSAAIHLVQGYRQRTDMLSVDYASQHVIATVGAMLVTLLLTFVLFPSGYELQSSRAVIALSFLALIPLTLSYRRLLYLRTAASHEGRTIVFVGSPQSFGSFREECRAMGNVQRVVFSVVEGDQVAPPRPVAAADVRPFSEVLDAVRTGELRVEAIVLRESARELEQDLAQKLVRLYFAGVPTYTLELFHEVYWQKIPLYRLNQTWLFQEGFQIAREPVFERAKRASDIVLAGLGLVLAAPLIAGAAIAIWLDDRGPAFFRQTRVGRNHVPFQIYKLRTMRVSDGRKHGRYTLPGDHRITRMGRFLRATRWDELPQLWNVIRGDMSLIGPRAEWDQLVEEYEQKIPCYHFRHLVRPGITGWAQVNYPYGASMEDTARKLEYDLYYIRHFSFQLDATIVLKTIHTMLFGRGR